MTTHFKPPGAWIHDVWLTKAENLWHAFYLQAPAAIGDIHNWTARHSWQQIGHAVSGNLVDWQDCGPAIIPCRNTWRDGIATGSVVRHNDKWWTLFTARSSGGASMGIAMSADLMQWEVLDKPLLAGPEPFRSVYRGETVEWTFLADPYILPDPLDGYYYVFVNAQVCGAPSNIRGCMVLLKTKDLLNYEQPEIVSWPKKFMRMETPCVWRHGPRWYLYFGGCVDIEDPPSLWTQAAPAGLLGESIVNCFFVADGISGPYEPLKNWCMKNLPDGRFGYIYKILTSPCGQKDVLLTTIDQCLSKPYLVKYDNCGEIDLDATGFGSARVELL